MLYGEKQNQETLESTESFLNQKTTIVNSYQLLLENC